MPKVVNKTRFAENEEYRKRIKGSKVLEEVDKFSEEVLAKNFDNVLLIATSDHEKDAIEDNQGDLCQGQMFMKLGSDESAKEFVGKTNLFDKRITMTVEHFQSAVLAELISKAIRAHCDSDNEKAAKFAESIAATIRGTYLSENSDEERAMIAFESGMTLLRNYLVANFSPEERVIAVGSLLHAIKRASKNSSLFSDKKDNKDKE